MYKMKLSNKNMTQKSVKNVPGNNNHSFLVCLGHVTA